MKRTFVFDLEKTDRSVLTSCRLVIYSCDPVHAYIEAQSKIPSGFSIYSMSEDIDFRSIANSLNPAEDEEK